jgi:hypothetical protein
VAVPLQPLSPEPGAGDGTKGRPVLARSRSGGRAKMVETRRCVVLTILLLLVVPAKSRGDEPAPAPAASALGPVVPFTVEGYYRITWGHQEEFLELFRRNHWPVLEAGIESGAIIEVSVSKPHFHASEERRWDLRVTIVWRNAMVATSSGGEATREIVERLYPDQEKFLIEERRRFELIEEHTDVPVAAVDTSGW